ncbi:MAG: MmgE/PrpD family protein [Candidatus Geothermarchaeales archaeon]
MEGSKAKVEKGDYTKKLASHVADFTYRDIPERVVEQTKVIILDTIGALLAASSPRYMASRIITDLVQKLGGREEATVIGRTFKTSAVNAALANGTMGYYCDIESHHPGAILHAAAVLIPTSLSVGEREGVSGRDIITSVVVGIDVEARVSFALTPTGQYGRGFHPSAICGCLAAAATAGKTLGLDEGQLTNAIGLSGCQASGLLAWESDRTEMSRPFQMGVAARNGVTSAMLAEMGFGGPEVLEGKYTIFDAFSGERNLEALTRGLGRDFEVMNLAIKRYSCCAFLHPGLDALLNLMDEHEIDPDEIRRITLRYPKSGARLIDNPALRSHSAQYILSVAAYNKRVMIDDILYEKPTDPRIMELSRRVRVAYDSELDRLFPERYPSIIEIETEDGKTLEDRVDHARGTPENPMTRDEIEEKFKALATTTADEERTREIIKVVDGLEKAHSIDELTELLRFKQSL